MAGKPTDCALFIDEQTAKFVIACQRVGIKNLGKVAKIIGITKSKAVENLDQAMAVGVFDESGNVTPIAQQIVNAIIKKRVDSLKE